MPNTANPTQPIVPVQPVAPVQAPVDGETGTLADVLVSIGALTQANADQIKLDEIQSGSSQEDIIKKDGIVPEESLVRAKSQLYNIPYVDLSKIPVEPVALSVLPSEIADRFKVFPVGVDRKDNSIILAMADPLDLSAIEFIEQKTGYHVKPRAALPTQIEEYIQTHYTTSLTREVTAALKEFEPEGKEASLLIFLAEGLSGKKKLRKLFPRYLILQLNHALPISISNHRKNLPVSAIESMEFYKKNLPFRRSFTTH